MNEKQKKILFVTVKAFISMLAFAALNSIEKSNSLAFLLSFGICFVFFFHVPGQKNIWIILASLVLSILLTIGKYPVYVYEYNGTRLLLVVAVSLCGSFIFGEYILSFLYRYLDEFKIKTSVFPAKKVFFISFAVILLFWSVVWVAEYPGNISPDTLNQFTQIFGDRKYSNANPLIHTLMIQGLYQLIACFTEDVNRNISIIALVQMAINSLIYAYCVSYIHSRSKCLPLTIGSVLFYAFISYNAIYNISISKDALYASLTVLFLILFDKLCLENSRKNNIAFVITATLFCLIRSNGFYTYLLLFGLLLVLSIRYRFKKILILFTASLLLTMLIRSPVYGLFMNSANRKFENDTEVRTGYYFKGSFFLCVPFEQVANVVYKQRELTKEEISLIEEYAPLEMIRETYNPIFVDDLFNLALDNAKDSRADISDLEYIRLWIRLGLKYPSDYLEAYANLTRYYYYPNRTVNTAYIGICSNDYGFTKETLISSSFTDTVDTFLKNEDRIPFIGLLFCPGNVSFIMIAGLFYMLKKKDSVGMLQFVLLFGNLLVLMACVPLNDEFRYIYPIVACLPFILYRLIGKNIYMEGEKR